MTDEPPLSGKEKYEARRREQKAMQVRQQLPTPQALARRAPAPFLWLIAIVGWFVALGEFAAVALGLSWDWTPKLTIEAQASHYENNPLGTGFLITNSGRVSLTNLHFSCLIDKDGMHANTSDNIPGQEPVSDFAARAQVTKDCGTFILGIQTAHTLDFDVSYSWFWSKDRLHQSKHFVIRRGAKGEFYAVPD